MQRAKQHWYKEGDRNSNFFHAFVTSRRETNTISSLKDANGVLQTDKDRIESIIGSHYADIFSSSMPSQDNIDKVLSRVRTKVTDEMATALSQPFTADEIKRALKHMHPFKSPSPDGAGTGVVVYDAAEKFVQGHSKKFPGISNAEVAELLALREALWVGRQLNLSLVEIFGDAAAIILAINGESHFPISCAAISDLSFSRQSSSLTSEHLMD
ncbi:hypothetical protein DH2020_002921 [Rehmannia glutinosa]|uniref:RNase H type-1 domain-containing protein n=1 Tax=Rehmannia glutinosa TaxID=99300 RepID=A0ABR0XVK1_REHGL